VVETVTYTSTPTERRGYNFPSSRIVATSLCRGAAVPSAPASTPTERRGYNFPSSRIVATSLCRGAAVPSAPASTPTERRGYNLAYSRFVATSLCRGAAVPSASASTPTERRDYNFPSSRLVATSLCRGAVVPSATASTSLSSAIRNPQSAIRMRRSRILQKRPLLADDALEDLKEAKGRFTRLAVADGTRIDLNNRHHFGGCSRQE
jgi:hypothetical protein